MNLTIHILTKDHPIDQCVESLLPLEANIIVANLGNPVENPHCKIINIYDDKDLSKIRNNLVEMSNTEWQFCIEPWEIIQSGHEELLWAITQNENIYNVYSIQENLLTKPTRLWKKSFYKFINPIYEILDPITENKLLNCVLVGNPPPITEKTLQILNDWKSKQPHAVDIEYYIANTYLSSGRYDEFLKHANTFLFRTSIASTASIMTHYYMAIVLLKIKNKPADCINHTLICLAQQPTMAEFWCLLGDAFVKLKQFQRASAFYDNAIIFGEMRLNDDSFPIEIDKYKIHPEKMIDKCKEIISSMYV